MSSIHICIPQPTECFYYSEAPHPSYIMYKLGILSDLIVLETETHVKFGNPVLNRKNTPKMW